MGGGRPRVGFLRRGGQAREWRRIVDEFRLLRVSCEILALDSLKETLREYVSGVGGESGGASPDIAVPTE